MKIKPFSVIEVLLIALLSSILTSIVAAFLVITLITQPFHKEAVDRGFATWEVTDNSTGETKFTWNEAAQGLHRPNPDIFAENEKPLEAKK